MFYDTTYPSVRRRSTNRDGETNKTAFSKYRRPSLEKQNISRLPDVESDLLNPRTLPADQYRVTDACSAECHIAFGAKF